jgi:lipopolysaccharide transport system permease protein
MISNKNNYKVIIKAKKGFFSFDLHEIWEYKEILFFLALRQIKVRYKQTIMGALWAVLQPFLTMIVFTIIFGNFAKIPSENIPYPIFSYSGLVLWTYFSTSLSQAGNSLVDNSNLVTKVYFPRLFIPTSSCLAGLVDYGVAMCIILLMMVYYKFVPNIKIIIVPLVVFTTFILASGISYWISSICVKYRDIKFILPFFIQLLMFTSPVIYPSNIVSEKYRWLLYLNPMTGLINAHRASLLGYKEVNFTTLSVSIIISFFIFVTGIIFLKNTEKGFADLI